MAANPAVPEPNRRPIDDNPEVAWLISSVAYFVSVLLRLLRDDIRLVAVIAKRQIPTKTPRMVATRFEDDRFD